MNVLIRQAGSKPGSKAGNDTTRGFECHTRRNPNWQGATPVPLLLLPTPCPPSCRSTLSALRVAIICCSSRESLCRSALERKSRQRLKQCLTKHLRHSIIAPREVPHTERQREKQRKRATKRKGQQVSAGQSRRWLIKLSTNSRRNKFQKIYMYIYLYRRKPAIEL